ncbi:MAG: BON domain-containing protein [Deltaproteobacteria bacterium]|nr:BON domain-containing protein [Deltaproteobacteria bacterium]
MPNIPVNSIPFPCDIDPIFRVEYPDKSKVPSDEEIETRIKNLLMWNPDVDATDINPDGIDVEVKNGVVYLSVSVSDRRAYQAIQDTARYSPGVVDVENKMIIT